MPRRNPAISRRAFLRAAGLGGAGTLALLYGCRGISQSRAGRATGGKRVIILGIDGMDPQLCERLMERGELPNLSRLRQAGGYRRLGTSIPPQSPVAWANFITGAGPGTHGIFDFIHRDPTQQCSPHFAAAQTVESQEGWEVGEHRIPLTFWPFCHQASQTLLRREGTPFWDHLDAAGIPAWIYDIPSNYPPSPSRHGRQFALSGMGTPDLLGSYGTYQYFSDSQRRVLIEGGGIRKPLVFQNHVATAKLTGPRNTLLKKPVDAEVEFKIYRHPDQPMARIELPDRTLVLRAGEWSDWCRVSFPLRMPSFLPDESVRGICRFYLQEVRPSFRLYVSPINIDPSDPGDQRISEPKDFVQRIFQDLGLFYTTGFQEDHKALSNRIFTDEEYLEQANYVLQERLNLLDFALRHYDDGLLFFYFSSTDLQAHMFWWDSDAPHPVRSAAEARKYHGVIEQLYRRMDGVVGDLIARYPQATLLVVSDHGFCSFRRQFNVNSWLRAEGYLWPPGATSLFALPGMRSVDWTRSRAYGLGLNAVYLNLKGRERDGIVTPAEREDLVEELRARLLAVRDPVDGRAPLASVYRGDQVYTGPCAARAPDLILGYARDYRCSWDAALGTVTDDVFADNDSAWSADHCMAAEQIPGVVFSTRSIEHPAPALIDLAPTILEEFGLSAPPDMVGRSLWRRSASA